MPVSLFSVSKWRYRLIFLEFLDDNERGKYMRSIAIKNRISDIKNPANSGLSFARSIQAQFGMGIQGKDRQSQNRSRYRRT